MLSFLLEIAISLRVGIVRDELGLDVLTGQACLEDMVLMDASFDLVVPDPATAELVSITTFVQKYVALLE